MKKLRLFICAFLGHRSIVLYRQNVSAAKAVQWESLSECERCGKKIKRTEMYRK